jgi:hypothetical protein
MLMTDLPSTLTSVLIDRFTANAARVHELAAPLTNSQFWQKPYPYGNSFGHLVLHLTGNLNYYIGAQMAKTGYVRDPPARIQRPESTLKRRSSEAFGRCRAHGYRCRPRTIARRLVS